MNKTRFFQFNRYISDLLLIHAFLGLFISLYLHITK